jgi:hypothetical protein
MSPVAAPLALEKVTFLSTCVVVAVPLAWTTLPGTPKMLTPDLMLAGLRPVSPITLPLPS